ncbi:MAG: cytochrome P450 [Alphaproteobacteria bacterium]|nr:cytochrome P450 [Alphaproteobacteria bacterium]
MAAFPTETFTEEVVVQRFFGREHILLQRPEAIRHVLIENAQNYRRSPTVTRILRPMFGRGLFLSAGDEWREQRRSIAPVFAPRAVRMLARQVVAATDRLVVDLASVDDTINMVPVFQRLALEVIGGAIFSLDMRQYGPELRELILRYAARLGRPSLIDFLLPLGFPTPADFARARFRRRWLQLIDRIIADRAARPSREGPRDLFEMLAGANSDGSPGLRGEQLGDQIATIVVAGHETTAAALFWILYLLAKHPDEQERLANEVMPLGLTPANAAELLPQLVRTRAVVDEALRLYPPAFVIVRQAIDDDEADGIPVRNRSLVLIAPWVMHRHHRFWKAPDRFDPSRFMPDAPPPPRFAYMPFGAGPRICVGQPFALTELVLVVATLLRAFRIELASRRMVHAVGLVTLQPDFPPPFRLTARAAG